MTTTVSLTNSKYVTALYAGLGYRLIRSIDGGVTWTASPGSMTTWLEFLTPTLGFTFGATVKRTTDGGLSWTQVDSGTWKSLSVLPSGMGWIVGASGTMKYTVDMGATWSPSTLPSFGGVDLNSVCSAMKPDGTFVACAVGNTNAGTAVILRSTDGTSWSSISGGGTSNLIKVGTIKYGSLAGQTLIAAAASGGTRKSTDYAASWAAGGGNAGTASFPPYVSDDGEVVLIASTAALRRSLNGTPTYTDAPGWSGGCYGISQTQNGVFAIRSVNGFQVQSANAHADAWTAAPTIINESTSSGMSAVTGFLSVGPSLTLEAD